MLFHAVQMEAVLQGGQSSREGELCVQAVFTLLDTLTKWRAEQRGASPTGSGIFRHVVVPSTVSASAGYAVYSLARWLWCRHGDAVDAAPSGIHIAWSPPFYRVRKLRQHGRRSGSVSLHGGCGPAIKHMRMCWHQLWV